MIASLLDLRYVENTDVGFNLLRWMPQVVRSPMLSVLGVVAVMALVGVLLRWRGNLASTAALVLFSGGAIGNSLDRLLRGYVVDFIHVPYWPVFNLADIWVTAGAALMLLTYLRHHDHDEGTEPVRFWRRR